MMQGYILLLRLLLLSLMPMLGLLYSKDCPITVCSCSPKIRGENRVIDCRNKKLRKIPYIQKSLEIFKEITFANDRDPNTEPCDKCNIFEKIDGNVFKNIKVQSLDFRNTKMSKVSRNAFGRQKKYLKRIVLSGDGKSAPPYKALKRLTFLQSLEVISFKVGYMNEKSQLLNFPELQHLRLQDLKLLYIQQATFVNKLPNLKKLEISDNRDLDILPVRAIQVLSSLVEFIYIDNGLKVIPYRAFTNLPNLKELDLSDNKIWKLSKDCFYDTNLYLVSLDLKLNQLNELSIGELAKTKWKRLEILDLSSNELHYLNSEMFKNMPELRDLRIPLNKIRLISPMSFNGLVNLKELDLSDNDLQTIPENAFLELKNLAHLDLVAVNQGASSALSLSGVFNGLEDLERLNLKQTKVVEEEIWNELQDLTSLVFLGLGDTGLTYIPDHVFQRLSRLTTIDLSRNNIAGKLRFEHLDGLQGSLKSLDLRLNSISSINDEIFLNFPKLKRLNLFGNPLKCGCNLVGLYDWLRRMSFLSSFLVGAVCESPPQLYGTYLMKLDLTNCLRSQAQLTLSQG